GAPLTFACKCLTRGHARHDMVHPPAEAATAGATEAAMQLSLEVLKLIDFVLPGNEPDLTRRLRGSLLRLNPNRHDIEMLCGILSRIKRGLQRPGCGGTEGH